MILKLFKLSYFAQIALLISLTLIIWLPSFIKPGLVLSNDTNTFTSFIFSSNLLNLPKLNVLLGFILLLIEAFLLSHLFSSHQLTHGNTFLSGFIFALFLSRTPSHLSFHPALIALLFLLLGLTNLLENFKSIKSLNLLLSASIWFSLASLFIPSVILIFPVIWISLILFQSFSWRSIPISIFGLLIPYLFIALGYFWYDKIHLFIEHIQLLFTSLLSVPSLPNTYEVIELIFFTLLLFVASSFILPRIGNQVISIRKKTSFMYWFLGFSIIFSFFNANILTREIVFIPFAAILGFYFRAVKRQFWADLFISLIFILIIFQNYRVLFYA